MSMKEAKKAATVATALTGVLALNITLTAPEAQAAEGQERCYGIAAAGQNDCGNAAHDCAGMAEFDLDASEWIYVPEGTCERITGGRLVPPLDQPKEQCYGIALAGQNDCGNGIHECAGESTVDRDDDEWMYVPEGTCEKIAGGSLEADS